MADVRCSALPRILRCPASRAQPADLKIGSDGAAAAIGTSVHAALAAHVGGQEVPFKDMDDSTRPLYYMALQIWRDYCDYLSLLSPPETRMEAVFEDWTIGGTPDLVAQIPAAQATLVVWDWKTAQGSIGDYRDQLLGYVWLAKKAHPDIPNCKIIIAWVRDRSAEIMDVDDSMLAEWEKRLKWALAHPDTYRPSEYACRYCGAVDCPARAAYLRGAASALMKVETDIAPADLAELYPQSRALAQALKQYDAALRIALAKAGELDMDDGKVLTLTPRTTTTIDTVKALASLKEILPDVDLTPALKIQNRELKSLISAGAARGQKGKEIERVMGELDAAGAVSTRTSKVISVRRKEKPDGKKRTGQSV